MMVTVLPLANVVWPGLYISGQMLSPGPVLAGLSIEAAMLMVILKEPLARAAWMSVAMNLVSTVVGLVAIPASTFMAAVLFFFVPTFSLPVLLASVVAAAFTSAGIEWAVLRYAFKKPLGKGFWLLALANVASTGLAMGLGIAAQGG